MSHLRRGDRMLSWARSHWKPLNREQNQTERLKLHSHKWPDGGFRSQTFWFSSAHPDNLSFFCSPRNSKVFEGKGTGGPHHYLQVVLFRLLNQLFPSHSLWILQKTAVTASGLQSVQMIFCRQMDMLFSSQGLTKLNVIALDQLWVNSYYSTRYVIIHNNFTREPYANSNMVLGLKHGKGAHLSKKRPPKLLKTECFVAERPAKAHLQMQRRVIGELGCPLPQPC